MKVKGFQLFCLVVLIGGQSVASARQNNGLSLPKLHSSKLRREVFLSRNKVIGSTKHSKALKMVTIPRGGACSDTNPVVFAKIGTTSIVESFALYGILWSSVKLENSSILPSWLPTIFNQSLVVLLASLLVVFGSSFIGAIVDGGMSAATNQALSPTEVAGDPDWYAKLAKPSWNPPGWVFPIMWLIVSKPTQLVGLLRILKYGFPTDKKASTVALVVFTTHLALGNVSILKNEAPLLTGFVTMGLGFVL